MKPSGVSWIGDIPFGWSMTRVKDLSRENCEQLTLIPDTIRYVDIGSVSVEVGIRNVQILQKSDVPSRARRLPKPGDIIVSNVRTYLRAIAKIKEAGLVVSTGFSVLTPLPKTNAEFMFYALQSESFMAGVDAASKGISYPAISGSALRNLNIVQPPLSEQGAIASYLDDRTKAVDSKIQLLEEKATALADLRKSVIHQAVTKGLALNVKMKASEVALVGDIPTHWAVKRLRDISDRYGSGKTPPGARDEAFDIEGQYWLTSSNFDYGTCVGNIRKLSAIGKIEVPFFKGPVLAMNGIGTIGNFAVFPYGVSANQQINLYSLQKVIDFSFARFVSTLLVPQALNAAVSSTLSICNASKMSRLFIPLPPFSEQQAIAVYLDERTSVIDESIKTLAEQVTALKSLRQSLIHEAVTGKIDVADFGYKTA